VTNITGARKTKATKLTMISTKRMARSPRFGHEPDAAPGTKTEDNAVFLTDYSLAASPILATISYALPRIAMQHG
jgi:hypothetical protein